MLKKVLKLPEVVGSIVTTAVIDFFCILSIMLTSQLFVHATTFRIGTIAALVLGALGTIISQIGIIHAKLTVSKIGIYIMFSCIVILTILIIIAMV